ncbi:MAG TPA: ferric reductase-like transmembrane domain-containing protein [Cryobacterium sp.]|nr:ferric reductase-like transmembrane domain-containing protein [Cryobacterium sp.]
MSIDTRTTQRHHRSAPAPLVRPDYRQRMRLADTLQVLCIVSVALVVALFLDDGGAARFATPADALTSIGVLAGLVGTDLLLIMMLLAARLPAIDRAFGHDSAMALHQSLGKPALYLILAHAVLLIVGYSLAGRVSVFAEVWRMLTVLPDMVLAFVGLGLLVLVVVSSIVIVRHRLPYEVWHIVHLLSYVAVLASLPHQLTVGALLAAGSPQWFYWLALYVGVAGSILVFRFIVPVVRSLRARLRVEGVDRVADGVVSIRLSGHNLRRLQAHSGQFFIWRFWTPGLWWQAHPFSLSAAPTGTSLRITVRSLGDASAALGGLRRGTRVSVEGPYGLFTDRARTSPRLVLVAAGIGVAPIRSLLETATFLPGQATVILRSHTVGDSYLADELAELCRARGAEFRIIAGKRPPGVNSWLPAEALAARVSLKTLVPHLRDADVYVCGPRRWTDEVVRDARAAGLPTRQIHCERFDW